VAQLKSMSVPKIMELKCKVEAAIAEQVKARRIELEMELSKLARHDSSAKRGKVEGRVGPRGPVAPKYRNSKDTSQTWPDAVYRRFGYARRSRRGSTRQLADKVRARKRREFVGCGSN
jgi:hypothetical protein